MCFMVGCVGLGTIVHNMHLPEASAATATWGFDSLNHATMITQSYVRQWVVGARIRIPKTSKRERERGANTFLERTRTKSSQYLKSNEIQRENAEQLSMYDFLLAPNRTKPKPLDLFK